MGKEEMSNLPDETLTYPPKCDDLYMFYFQEAEVNLFFLFQPKRPTDIMQDHQQK